MSPKRGAVLAVVVAVAGCSSSPDAQEDDSAEGSAESITAAGGRGTLHYLGSSSFLRQCAGETLGCGRAVSSVSDDTPYFSAPAAWGRKACDQWYTFRTASRCVEARRFEVSDKRNFIEGNPAVFAGLGLSHSDGHNCAGSGQAAVTVTAGRNCDE